jgi:hypothetical protein
MASTSSPARPDALRMLTAFGSPIALGTTLMLYFGWVRSEAQARAFGADASVFAMTGQELVMRSVDTLFAVVVPLLLLALLGLRLDPWLRSRARPALLVLRWTWLAAPLGLLLAVVAGAVGIAVLPVLVLGAVAGTAYAAALRREVEPATHPPLRISQHVLIVLLLIVVLFWATERWARLSGEALAAELQADLDRHLDTVTLFTAQRLPTTAATIEESRFGADEEAVYRYEGLYLLQRSGGKYFLLSDGWSIGEGRLLVVPDNDSVRLEFGG